MKCISKNNEVKRVSDSDADVKVKQHEWKYVPRSVWKLYTRGDSTVVDKVVSPVLVTDTDELSIEQKRLMRKKRTTNK